MALATSCSHPTAPLRNADRGIDTALFDPATVLQDEWQHLRLKHETNYHLVPLNGGVAFRATGNDSASGLTRRIMIDPSRCPVVEWEWLVNKVQPSAHLYRKDRDDVGASILLLFGDPGFLFDPRPVPTVRYLWTNKNVADEEVIDNRYLPGIVRRIVVRRGARGEASSDPQMILRLPFLRLVGGSRP